MRIIDKQKVESAKSKNVSYPSRNTTRPAPVKYSPPTRTAPSVPATKVPAATPPPRRRNTEFERELQNLANATGNSYWYGGRPVVSPIR